MIMYEEGAHSKTLLSRFISFLSFFFSNNLVSYEQSAITYVWKNDEATLRKSPSLTTLNAYLITNQTVQCEIKGSWRGSYGISIEHSCSALSLMFLSLSLFVFSLNAIYLFGERWKLNSYLENLLEIMRHFSWDDDEI